MIRARRRLVSLALAGALATLTGVVRAEDPVAEAMFDEGVRLLKENKIDEACASIERAVDLAGGTAIGGLMLLGDCRERQGRPASAWSAYRRAFAAAQQRGDPRDAKAAAAVARLEPTLPRLVVRVAPELRARTGLEIRRGDTALPRETWGVPFPVDPGNTTLVAEVAGAPPHRVEVVVPAQATTVEAYVGPWPDLASPTNVDRDRREPGGGPSLLRTPGVVGVFMGGGGALALGTGIAMGFIAKSRYDVAISDPTNACAAGLCNARGKEAIDSARGLGTAGTIATIAGAALFATGGALVVVDLASRRRTAGGHDASLSIDPSSIRLRARF
jgi:hypothetical protein